MRGTMTATIAMAMLAAGAAQAQTAAPPRAPAPAAPGPAAAPLKGGRLFISPMGEPFYGKDGLSGAELWFEAVDADHDGRITLAEMQAEAGRFFDRLDTDKSGDLGPDEIERYETVVAPEIRVDSTYGDPALAKTDDDGNVTDPPYPTRIGAGRFGYLDMPEPVISADTNFDRGVSRDEFMAAALKRFHMLDTHGDGVLTRDELPTLSAHADTRHGGGDAGGHRFGGHGHHGGGGGGGFGGGGGGFGGAGGIGGGGGGFGGGAGG